MTIWKEIPRYSNYLATSDGEILSKNWKRTGKLKLMHPSKDKSGYLRTMLVGDNGKTNTVKVHRIVASAFLGDKKEMEVNHKNGIKHDNRPENLEWCTRQENIKHCVDNNLQAPFKGEEIGNSKLKEWQVIEIREKFIPRVCGRKKLAEMYGVKPCTIKDIILGRSWKHLL